MSPFSSTCPPYFPTCWLSVPASHTPQVYSPFGPFPSPPSDNSPGRYQTNHPYPIVYSDNVADMGPFGSAQAQERAGPVTHDINCLSPLHGTLGIFDPNGEEIPPLPQFTTPPQIPNCPEVEAGFIYPFTGVPDTHNQPHHNLHEFPPTTNFPNAYAFGKDHQKGCQKRCPSTNTQKRNMKPYTTPEFFCPACDAPFVSRIDSVKRHMKHYCKKSENVATTREIKEWTQNRTRSFAN